MGCTAEGVVVYMVSSAVCRVRSEVHNNDSECAVERAMV